MTKIGNEKKIGDTKNFAAKIQLKLWQNSKYDKTETPIVTRPKQSKCTEKNKRTEIVTKINCAKTKKVNKTRKPTFWHY